MKAPDKYPAMADIYYCLHGKKPHKAYWHAGLGIGFVWCPIHGILTSNTGRLVGNERAFRHYDCNKQMTPEQQTKFRARCLRRQGLRE